ncbi:soluble pyridine nucleotide transhydrogenase [Vibrio variabilis]|uniref:Soluble pyridine nucleotide transhydrogenase n=1 Tax=Vibrio variabilis TaxID=990271 RepID=A0ABQ0J8R6_9VIBR|nr:soluble pyridine nucleotide transhydrogenase [Vibrio variabilis]
MSRSKHFDAIVIGSGPGGEGAAMGLTKAGLNVAIIEKESSVGGGCTHWGTILLKLCVMRLAVSLSSTATLYFAVITPVCILRFPIF